jgi:hypothetical protein
MSQSASSEELIADANAYLHVGDIANAVKVLFEGVASDSKDGAAAIESAVRSLCRSLWEARNVQAGQIAARTAVDQIQKHLGVDVEPIFAEIYAAALAETGASPFPLRRLYRHRNLLRVFNDYAARLDGSMAECGCASGLSSLELCFAVRELQPAWQGDGFHIFDSFEGLSAPTQQDALDISTPQGALLAPNMVPGHFAFARDVVERNLHRLFPRAELHAGWIPGVFRNQPELTYRFVHVDVDLYQPTLDSLRYFFPRLCEGGIIISDDYNWPGAKKACDEFSAERGVELHTTDTNQAYLVRG